MQCEHEYQEVDGYTEGEMYVQVLVCIKCGARSTAFNPSPSRRDNPYPLPEKRARQ